MIDTQIAGIPCKVKCTYYEPEDPGRSWGPPEDCWPPEPAVVDFTVLDRRGRPAPWLERKLQAEDIERIECEIIQHIEQEKEDDRY
jgi:hypothetical protein